MPVALTRTVGFRAVHRLYRADWTAERNRETFGPLSEPPGHPHDYRCAVTVTGPLDPAMGMGIDLVELDRVVQEEIVAPFDGCNLNQDVADFASGATLPTCEALAVLIYRRVAPRLPAGVSLARVRVAEDATLHADCTELS
jgi:6-pyruvoyltetrahydropterin/6-carboxytetrahydropterin synthase